MAHINVTIDTNTKTYQGKLILNETSSMEDASNTVKAIASGVNSLEYLSLESNGTAIIFSKAVLSKSVISLTPME